MLPRRPAAAQVLRRLYYYLVIVNIHSWIIVVVKPIGAIYTHSNKLVICILIGAIYTNS